MFTIADRRLLSTFGNQSLNTKISQTQRAAFSQTVTGQSVNITALNSTSLFGTNTALLTTLTVEGRDTGARVTIPVKISKTQVGQVSDQAQQGISLR
mgnify:FL=1